MKGWLVLTLGGNGSNNLELWAKKGGKLGFMTGFMRSKLGGAMPWSRLVGTQARWVCPCPPAHVHGVFAGGRGRHAVRALLGLPGTVRAGADRRLARRPRPAHARDARPCECAQGAAGKLPARAVAPAGSSQARSTSASRAVCALCLRRVAK